MGSDLLTESLALYDDSRWEEAGAMLVALLAEQPGNVTAWFRLGNVRGEQGRDDEAVDCFKRAVTVARLERAGKWTPSAHMRTSVWALSVVLVVGRFCSNGPGGFWWGFGA